MTSWAAMKAVIKVKTFQIIVLQGIIGSLPWTAMVFFTMWFELIGENQSKFCTKAILQICVFLALELLLHYIDIQTL